MELRDKPPLTMLVCNKCDKCDKCDKASITLAAIKKRIRVLKVAINDF